MKRAFLIEMTVLKSYVRQLVGLGFFVSIFVSIGMQRIVSVPGILTMMMFMMGSMSAAAYDEQSGWGLFRLTMPVSRRDVVLARYGVGAIVTRGIKQTALDDYVAVSPIPIINSTNDDFDPIQTVCDLFTIWERKRRLEGLKIAYIGKGSHVAASLIMGAVKCGMEVAVATPDEFRIKREHVLRAEQYGTLTLTDDPYYAAKDADIIYTDSYRYHTRISDEELHIMAPYKVNNSIMSTAKPDAMFMHPLPASRGVEVTADVIDGKQSAVMEQAENKLHAIKGILGLLID